MSKRDFDKAYVMSVLGPCTFANGHCMHNIKQTYTNECCLCDKNDRPARAGVTP